MEISIIIRRICFEKVSDKRSIVFNYIFFCNSYSETDIDVTILFALHLLVTIKWLSNVFLSKQNWFRWNMFHKRVILWKQGYHQRTENCERDCLTSCNMHILTPCNIYRLLNLYSKYSARVHLAKDVRAYINSITFLYILMLLICFFHQYSPHKKYKCNIGIATHKLLLIWNNSM